jgi:UDP-2,3-diacylglucosamine hydrolase
MKTQLRRHTQLDTTPRARQTLGTGTDYFVADVHLAPDAPDVSHRFVRFLDRVRQEAGRLFLLGDIFDIWVGRKQARMPYAARILEKLRELAYAGVEVHYIAGNRDFNFDARVSGGPSAQHLPEVMSVESGARTLYLTHGDLLCTRDRSYQRARRIVRSPFVRGLMDGLPLRLTRFAAEGYRRLSKRAVKRKTTRTLSMDFSWVKERLKRGYDAVICGHSHDVACYKIPLPGGRLGEFITLGDWRAEGVYLVAEGGDLTLRRFG